MKPTKEQYEQWQTDPKNWKLGIFYFNKLDNRILLPKRIKAFGWTINFANPYSNILLFAILVGIFLITFFLKYF